MATGGFTSTGLTSTSTGNAGANSIFITQVTLVNNATISAVLIGLPNSTTSINFKALIYDGSHSALKGAGSTVTSVASGYNRFPLVGGSISLTAGTYYVGYVCDSSCNVNIGGSGSSWFVSGGQSVSSPANPLSGGSSNGNMLQVALEFDGSSSQGYGWAPDFTNGVTLSSSNAVATLDGARGEVVRSIVTQSAVGGGKWYAELVVGSSIVGASPGVIAASAPLSSPSGSNLYIELLASGNFSGTTSVASTPSLTYTTGDVLGIAYDATSALLWMNKNGGTWSGGSGTPNPATGVGGVSVAPGNWPVMVTAGGTAATTWTLHDHLAAQSFAPPSGFSPWSPAVVVNGLVATSGLGSLSIQSTGTGPIRKQVAAPGFPFAVFESENNTYQAAAPGALSISQTAPAPNVNVNLTGASSTSAVGTASVAGSASPTLTGVVSTSAVNAPNIEIDESLTLTGVASTSAVGTPTFSAGNLSLTGVETDSSVGTPTVEGDESITLTGVAAIGAVGILVAGTVFATGVAATAHAGAPVASISLSVTLTGVAATSAEGSVSTYSSNLNGVQATIGLGAIVAQSFPVLVGQASTTAAGSPTVYISTINGVQATTGIGTDIVVVTQLPTLVGQQAIASAGFVQALATVNQTNAAITGVSLSSGLGIVGTSHPGPVMAGTAASSGVGAVSVTTSAIADVGMTIGQLAVEQRAGVPLVDVDLTVRWSDTEGQSWADSVIKTLGFAGNYNTSIQVRRMGMSRHGRVYELSWSAPFPTALAGATLMFTDAGT